MKDWEGIPYFLSLLFKNDTYILSNTHSFIHQSDKADGIKKTKSMPFYAIENILILIQRWNDVNSTEKMWVE